MGNTVIPALRQAQGEPPPD